MRRPLVIFMSFLLIFSITLLSACRGKGKTATEPASKQDVKNTAEVKVTTTETKGQAARTERSDMTGTSTQKVKEDLVVYESYNAFLETKSSFLDYALVDIASGLNLELAAKLPEVVVHEAIIFNYLTPLIYIGQSKNIHGKLVTESDESMLKALWGEDAVLTYDESTGYYAKGKDVNGNIMEYNIRFNGDLDSLKLEVSKNGTKEFLFEYTKTKEGYAAQYAYETITGHQNFQPVYDRCTFRTVFHEKGGFCARFDGMNSWPDSIFEKVPDENSFIDGASHWFSIKDGVISGEIGGMEIK